MKTVLSSVDFAEAVLVKEIPNAVLDKEGIIETKLEATVLGIEGHKNASIMDGLYIEHNQVVLPTDLSVWVKKDVPHVELHFELDGFTSFCMGRQSLEMVSIPKGHCVLLYLPELDGRLNFAKNEKRESLEIEFTEEYFLSIFQQQIDILGSFGVKFDTKQPVFWESRSFKISPLLNRLLVDIIACKYHGTLKKIYLESKIREILVTFVHENSFKNTEERSYKWSKMECEKLQFAREIVQQNYAKPFSIVELAKLVGINDFKLKKGFRELFGMTIFGYINELRMQEAKLLLLETTLPIADISYKVGFKNPQHFTTAFKRQFGVLPKKIRNSIE